MLNPQGLLAETAKFFSLHPDKFITGGLTKSGKNPSETNATDCFCTVGYMAYRLGQESPTLRERIRNNTDEAYRVVAEFFGGRYGDRAEQLYHLNDRAGRVDTVAKLKDDTREFA